MRPVLGEAGYEEWLLNNSWGIEDDANMTVRELQLRQSLSGTYFKRRREVTPPMTPDAGLWTLDSPVPGSAEDIEGTTMDIDE